MWFSRSKLDEDAVDRIAVVTHKLIPQSPEKIRLLLVKDFMSGGRMIEIVTLCYSDTSMTATVNSFNRIGTHEYRNIPPNCRFGDTELMRQIVVCIMPSTAQHFQQFLASFCGTHESIPPSFSPWGDDKLSSVRLKNTRKNFLIFFAFITIFHLRRLQESKCGLCWVQVCEAEHVRCDISRQNVNLL